MALVMTPIYTQTVGAGGASSVTFNNIPQVYTDLRLVASVRTNRSAALTDDLNITFNSNTGAIYSLTAIQGSGSAAISFRGSSNTTAANTIITGAGATANSFGSLEVYFPNYTNDQFKSFTIDSVQESNGSESYMRMIAGLFRSTSAISSIGMTSANAANFVQHSTFSLYGIIRSGA